MNNAKLTEPKKTTGLNIRQSVCLIAIGICLGIMTGLSVSPVLGIVLGSILSITITIAAGLAGVEFLESAVKNDSPAKWRAVNVDATPLAMLTVSLLTGAVIGIFLRTHDVLGRPTMQIEQTMSLGSKAAGSDSSVNRADKTYLFTEKQSPIIEIAKATELSEVVRMLVRSADPVEKAAGERLNNLLRNSGDNPPSALDVAKNLLSEN